MKIRALHPEFFTDPDLCALPYEARILFAGLWCHSDDYGRGRWLPKAIEGDVFPRDDVDIETLLRLLVDGGFIVQFSTRGKSGADWFYFVPNWEKYQTPKYRAKTSIPEPPDETGSTGRAGPFGPDSDPTPGQPSLELARQEEEVEEVIEEEVEEVSLAPAPRPRNEVWDALAVVFGEPTTDSNRKLRGKVVASLGRANATGEQVITRAQAWPFHFEVELTETALEKHWDRLGRPPLKAAGSDVRRVEAAAESDRLRRERQQLRQEGPTR